MKGENKYMKKQRHQLDEHSTKRLQFFASELVKEMVEKDKRRKEFFEKEIKKALD